MRKWAVTTLAMGVVAILGSVSAAGPQARHEPAAVLVDFETSAGVITVEVDVIHAPITSANFLRYVDEGWYDQGRFHRTVRPETETNGEFPIQVIQASRRRGRGPGWPSVALERTRDTGLTHVDGAVSMARVAGRPDSAGSDFFVAIGPQPSLDFGGQRNADGQGFAVFGKVVAGMDVVKKIHASPVREGSQSLDPPIVILKASRQPPKVRSADWVLTPRGRQP